MVLDASAVLELLLRTAAGNRVEAKLFSNGGSLHAPHLIDVEIAQVIRRHATAGIISGSRGKEALQDLADLSLNRHAHTESLPRIWELRHNLTAYDAAYVALAEALDAPLLTCDRKLARASNHRARIELV